MRYILNVFEVIDPKINENPYFKKKKVIIYKNFKNKKLKYNQY